MHGLSEFLKKKKGSHFVQRASGVVVVILCVCVCVWGGVCECVNALCVKVTGCEGVCVRGVCEGWAWEVCEDMSGWMTSGQMAYIIFIVHMSI